MSHLSPILHNYMWRKPKYAFKLPENQLLCCFHNVLGSYAVNRSGNCSVLSFKGQEVWGHFIGPGAPYGATLFPYGALMLIMMIMHRYALLSKLSWTSGWRQTALIAELPDLNISAPLQESTECEINLDLLHFSKYWMHFFLKYLIKAATGNFKYHNNHVISKAPEEKKPVICSDVKTHFSLSYFCLHFYALFVFLKRQITKH